MRRWILAAAVAIAAPAMLFGAADLARGQVAQIAPFESSGDVAFDAWRADFYERAVAAGRDPLVARRLLSGLRPEPRVVSNDRNQAEFVRPVWDYITRAVSAQRVSEGQRLRQEHAAAFEAVRVRFGVDPDIIAGIWAIETNFGVAALPHDARVAIATLAAEGRRRAQFETYFLALIEMVERGYAGEAELRSSWAGALGQPQFMPDIYLRDAVDFDGDGKRDIWTNRGDVFASIANYLAKRGWSAGEPVFDEVRLPSGFDYALADGSRRTVDEWSRLGIRRIDGSGWGGPTLALQAQLFLPAGAQGPALLLMPNFAVIRSYNPSDRYALAVALLARGFAGREGLVQRWPTEIGALQRDETLELQERLNAVGFNAGVPDGMFGSRTRAGLRSWQQSRGLPADGYPTPAILQTLRNEALAQGRASARAGSPALDRAGILDLQRALVGLGHLSAKPNGKAGPATRKAVKAFEASLGLSATGKATRWALEEARAELNRRSAAGAARRR
jgi:membrane-bound lytic murein transglycosylase B